MTKQDHYVTKEEVHERIDKLLVNYLENHSRSAIQKWIQEGFVTVNNKQVKANYRCQINDYIQWKIPQEKQPAPKPENIPLEILFEDQDLLIVNKPKGMVVHPANAHRSGTLVNALLHYTDDLSQIAGENRPGIVHRIDKETSGLLIVAKNDWIHEKLSRLFQTNAIERHYGALVYGKIPHEKGEISAPIGRDPYNRLRMTVIDTGKDSLTHFQVVKRFPKYTYITCQLMTGRTHQIRVHMRYIGHPIVGDDRYAPGRKHLTFGQALFAKKLAFNHPRSGEKVQVEIELPQSFKILLQKVMKEA